MSLQSQIDRLLRPSREISGLSGDREALATALALGSQGGKRFRPWLLSTVHHALAGDHRAPAGVVDSVAAATELLHTAFVIHDDVIDNDDTRRGLPSVPGWFRTHAQGLQEGPPAHDLEPQDGADEAYTRAGAILAGDLALAAAVRGVATCGADPAVTGRLLDLLDATLHISAAGELADVRLTLGAGLPSPDEVLQLAECKTAAYSFVLPMQAGAVLAGAEEHVVRALGEIGRSLGVSFQLLDDLQGVFGDPAATGKDPLGDLREGKRTTLVVHAAHTSQWTRIAPHLGDPALTPTDAAQVRAALIESGSRQYVEQLAAEHLARARDQARTFKLHHTLVDPLVEAWTPRPPVPETGTSLREAGAA